MLPAKSSRYIVTFGTFLVVAVQAGLVIFDFESEMATPAVQNPLVSVSPFTLSSGSVSFPAGNESTDAVSGKGWNLPAGAKWWEFTIEPVNPGDQLFLTGLTFDDQRSGTGPIEWSVAVNDFPVGGPRNTHDSFGDSPMNLANLSAASFQELSRAEIRIFGFGAPSAQGTWRLDNVILDGAVTAVPEPGSTAILFTLGCALLAVGRRWIAGTGR